jgi:parallel beta-helix repeat protein
MKNNVIILIILLILSFQGLNGCVEQDSGNVSIIGKGSFDTIQKAIDAASDGDSIHVSAGQYDEILIINKSIKLIAEKNSTILQYIDNESDISIITINRDNCIVDGFDIIRKNISLNSNGIKVISSNNIITNNTIQNNNYGLLLQNSNSNIISNNIFLDNRNGLFMAHSLNNNIISNNFSGNNDYGVYASSQSDNNIFKLNYFSTNANGIRIKGSQQNQIEKNIIRNSDRRGVYLCCGALNNIVFNNSIIDNNPNADDRYNNQWSLNKVGNYWGDYTSNYPDSVDEDNDGFWDTPYTVYEETKDLFPLVESIELI